MEEETKVVLNLSGCRYMTEIHDRLQKALLLPEHYGRNWDALIDSLSVDSPVEYVEIRGENGIADELNSVLADLHDCLDIVKERCTRAGMKFDYRIVD